MSVVWSGNLQISYYLMVTSSPQWGPTIPIFTENKIKSQRKWSTCLKLHNWWNQGPSLSDFKALPEMAEAEEQSWILETFLCLAKHWAELWMDKWMCILFLRKCLFTVVGHLKVDFNERIDVLISYIEIHVNFDVLKICNWKQLLYNISKLVPQNVACKSADNFKLDLMSCFYNKLYKQ